MKVYSDKLTEADMREALPPLVGAHIVGIRNARVRRFGWEVNLEGYGLHHRRAVNSGNYGSGYHKAASYDDHGVWMAALFAKDPDARISWWKDAADFERGTEGKYSLAHV